MSQFLFISALCIAADLRDIDEDREDKIKTFPVAAGVQISKNIIILLLILQLVLLLILYNLSYLSMYQLETFVLVSLMSMIFTHKLNATYSYYYFILGIDGLILSQSLILFFSSK